MLAAVNVIQSSIRKKQRLAVVQFSTEISVSGKSILFFLTEPKFSTIRVLVIESS